MSRISSIFFMIALASYYIPKGLGKKNKATIKIHIVSGIISTVAMIIALVQAMNTIEVLKYIGFTIIMLIITGTGYLIKRKNSLFRKLHMVATVSFFLYLVAIIIL